jgi:cytochrome P450
LEEAKIGFGNETVLSFEKMVEGFQFTNAFIKETLRLKGPAHAMARYTLEKVTIGEHEIPKDVNLILK